MYIPFNKHLRYNIIQQVLTLTSQHNSVILCENMILGNDAHVHKYLHFNLLTQNFFKALCK